jgi:hypothetical protein
MDLPNIIGQLRAQLDHVNEGILALERIAAGAGPRRGRPPKWLAAQESAEAAPKRPGRPPGSKNKQRASKED